MRKLLFGLTALSLLTSAGCESLFRRPTAATEPVAEMPHSPPTTEILVKYLNRCANELQTLRTDDLVVEAKQGNQGGTVTGTLVCQQPRNFRLIGKALGSDEVDLGSNNQEFWFYIKRADNVVYRCRHEDLERGATKLRFPLQPEYIAQALGMAQYGEASHYRLNERPDAWELIEEVRSPQGQSLRKVVVFNKRMAQVRRGQPQVRQYRLEDANGPVVVADIQAVEALPGGYADGPTTYPTKIHLTAPREKMDIHLALNRVVVNRPIGQTEGDRLFRLPSGRQTIDLAALPVANPGARRMSRQ